jgi:hypothetical protein
VRQEASDVEALTVILSACVHTPFVVAAQAVVDPPDLVTIESQGPRPLHGMPYKQNQVWISCISCIVEFR